MTDQTHACDAQVRAEQLAELLQVCEQAGNTAEAVRVEFVADNERLRTTIAAITAAAFDDTLPADTRVARIRSYLGGAS